MKTPEIMVVGGGLAGSEAAWQLAEAGARVILAEMRPVRPTPVHGAQAVYDARCGRSRNGVGKAPGQSLHGPAVSFHVPIIPVRP